MERRDVTGERRSRRDVLRLGGAAALSAVAGCNVFDDPAPETPAERATDAPTATPATPTSRDRLEAEYGDRFDDVVDVVEAGADPSGEDRIDDVLGRVVADDTLAYFPAGDYRLGSFLAEKLTNAGLVGESPAQTSLVPAEPATDIDHQFLQFHAVADFLFSGFALDYSEPARGGATQVISRGDYAVSDVRVRGTMPDETLPNNPAAFRFDVRDASASGTVENVVATDGGHDGGNAVGLYVGKDHAGTLAFEDCVVAGFPNNGLYASAPGRDEAGFRGRDGTVHVRGGRYANNNVANVRLGSTGSTARDVTIVVDERPPTHAGALNARGLRVRNKGDQVIENCEIEIGADAGYGFGGLVFHPNAGSVTVRDTTIRVDRDNRHGIQALDDDPPGTAPGLTFENVSVTGSAAGGWAVAIAGREGVTFQDCAIQGTGSGRNGVSFTACEDCVVDGGEIAVPGIPLRRRQSTVQLRNVSTGQSET